MWATSLSFQNNITIEKSQKKLDLVNEDSQ